MSIIKAEETALEPGVPRAFELLTKHATRLHKQLQGLGTVRFAAFVVDVHFSTLAVPELPPAGGVAASFLSLPDSLGVLVDGEWRAATRSERYFTNWSMNGYESREVVTRTLTGPQGPSAAEVTNTLKDAGLRLRVDVNTKVNHFLKSGAIEVNETDFSKLRALGVAAVQEGLRMLRGAAK